MFSRCRRFTATLTLAASAGGWFLNGTIAIHAAQHDASARTAESAAALAVELLVHGHHHDHGAPVHQHPVAPVKIAPPPVGKASLKAVTLALDLELVRASMPARSGRWSGLASTGVGHDPPSFVGTHPILRI